MTAHLAVRPDRLAGFCQANGIVRLAVFGSALRDDFGPGSDIDLLVEFGPGRTPGLEFVSMADALSELFGRPVDLLTRPSVERSRNYIRRKAILDSAEVIYLDEVRDCKKTSGRLFWSPLGTKTNMTGTKHSPGTVRDAIVACLDAVRGDASVSQVKRYVEARIGEVPASSVRSYLRLRPDMFERTRHGRYRLRAKPEVAVTASPEKPGAGTEPVLARGGATLYRDDCFDWLDRREANSIHAVITDPPYGLVEYTETEQRKLREGKGGVWRIPPSFDGHKRSPLPRFTTLGAADLEHMREFFRRFGSSMSRVLVPGAHMFVASNPLVSHIVASALAESGLESRGMIFRLVMTMRGGDRPKNAHEEFSDVTVMPRSMAEPWLLFRNPLEGRVQDNLRKWGTGGLRRQSKHRPFGDVIESHPTRPAERRLAPHPSLKPQAFLRQLVRAALPLGKGMILDPFAGSGSTLAAANHLGYRSIGVELSPEYTEIAVTALPKLEAIRCPDTPSSCGASECRACRG